VKLLKARAKRRALTAQEYAGILGHFVELTKPRLTLLALATTCVGFYLGSSSPFILWRLFHTLFGSLLVGAGANALNQYMERENDARMKRTQKRPLPSRKMRAEEALIFGVVLSVAGLLHLGYWVNGLVALLGAVTVASYLFLYTPLKKVSPLCTVVGAIPGALPPVMGWAAARGRLDFEAWILFAVLFFWQIPHFYAIGWACREDYARADFKMLTVLDKEGKRTAREIAFYTTALFVVTLFPFFAGMTGLIYLFAAIFLGVFFLGFALALAGEKPLMHAREFFVFSIIYLFLLMMVMMMDKVPRAEAAPSGWLGAAESSGQSPPVQAASSELPRYGRVAEFALEESGGRELSSSELKGKTWVANFFFTSCPGQCPLMNRRMSALAKELSLDILFVSFTADPERDTQEELSRYAERFGAERGRWLFIRGEKEDLNQVARSFHMSSIDDPNLHSVRLVLIDRQGEIRGYYDPTDEESMRKLVRDAKSVHGS
jgi:protoheme IX farnesyltransferase